MARAASGARPCGRIRAAANPGDRPHQNRSLSSPFQNSPEKATPTPTGRTQVPITWALGWLRRRLTSNRDRLNTGLKCFQHKPPVSVQLVRPQESGAREEMARHLLKAIERIKRRAGRQIGNGEQSRAASEDGLCEALLRSPTPEPVTPALLHEKHGPDAACDPEGLEECVGGKGGVGGGRSGLQQHRMLHKPTPHLSSWIFLFAAQCQGYKTRQGSVSSAHGFDKWQLFEKKGMLKTRLKPNLLHLGGSYLGQEC